MQFITLILFSLLLFSCSEKRLPYYSNLDLKPEESSTHTIADFEFVDQNADTLSNSIVDGKIYIADFFFTTCQGICPDMTNNLLKIQRKFLDKSDLQILSFSVDPKNDTSEALKNYTTKMKITSKNWHLFTGEKRKLYELASKSFFAGELKYFDEEESFIHSENIYLVDPNKQIRGVYDGTESKEMKRLIVDIELLRTEFTK